MLSHLLKRNQLFIHFQARTSDHYSILGIKSNATLIEIKKKYY